MSELARKLVWLALGAAVAWFLGGQLLRAVAGPGYYPPASDSPLAILAGIGPLMICVAWAAFVAGDEWRRVISVACVLATAAVVGATFSDLLTHLAGEPVSHDTWFGDSYYWTGRIWNWLLSFIVFCVLVSLCVTVVRMVRRRRPAV